MAKEILKDEVLKDEQLEGVAGGTDREIGKDVDFMKAVGLMRPGENDTVTLERVFAQKGITVVFNEGKDLANEYYDSKGQQITRGEALNTVMIAAGKKVNINNYI